MLKAYVSEQQHASRNLASMVRSADLEKGQGRRNDGQKYCSAVMGKEPLPFDGNSQKKAQIQSSNYLTPISFPTSQIQPTANQLSQSRYKNFMDRNYQLIEKERERQREQAINLAAQLQEVRK